MSNVYQGKKYPTKAAMIEAMIENGDAVECVACGLFFDPADDHGDDEYCCSEECADARNEDNNSWRA